MYSEICFVSRARVLEGAVRCEQQQQQQQSTAAAAVERSTQHRRGVEAAALWHGRVF